MAYGFQIQTSEGLKDVTSNDDIGLRLLAIHERDIALLGVNVSNTGTIAGPVGFDISKGDILCWMDMQASTSTASYSPLLDQYHYAPRLSYSAATNVLTWDATRIVVGYSVDDVTLAGRYIFAFVHRE